MDNEDENMIYNLLREYEKVFLETIPKTRDNDKQKIINSLEKLRTLIMKIFTDLLKELKEKYTYNDDYVTFESDNEEGINKIKKFLKKNFFYEDEDFSIVVNPDIDKDIPCSLKFRLFKEISEEKE